MKKDILDSIGRPIGYTIKNGFTTKLYDKYHTYLGEHNEITDQVIDKGFKTIGKGLEILGSLLKK